MPPGFSSSMVTALLAILVAAAAALVAAHEGHDHSNMAPYPAPPPPSNHAINSYPSLMAVVFGLVVSFAVIIRERI